ncbi:oxidoreductase domain protein [Caldicellulosiruptor kronotskyensis 2002]|uniref:Oxidoreductase domain protein n=2 Tax=Caldicellulosiruptor kronotskyensis (strain DSM 18902 / VKM B-2412 / 2002) TaxID=632348 RepID=E4SD67_CALK2|nr:Gfo/Idh/MocA family oxidoreductase [Caldicellulosiruptor kronotskyensis]ADQ45131.1 oxidoreductase domain protein [Caldicellulosiruptor kronotskyensis 2002]
MSKLKFGIVGCGVISKTHAIAISALSSDAELVAVCDVIEDRARKLAQDFGVKKIYTDYEKMLLDSDIDVISICTPSGMHADMAALAADAKKHVIVEKPMDITLSKADKIIEAQNRNNVVISIISQHRYSDCMQLLKRLMNEGKFGKIVLATSYTKWYRSQEYYDSGNWRGTWSLDGGGALMNQSIHYIDMIQWIVGKVEEVYAYCTTRAHKRIEVEDCAVACVKFENGAIGEIVGTTSAYPGFETRLEIFGEHGSAIAVNTQLESLYFKDGSEKEYLENYKKEDRGPVGASSAAIKEEGHVRQYRDVINAIKTGTKPLIPAEEGRHPVEIILAIYLSSLTGRPVKLPLESDEEVLKEIEKIKGKGF